MFYLSDPEEILTQITKYQQATTLWMDTEVADYQTSKPRLSLIQVLHKSTDLQGEHVGILDVLNCPEIVQEFVAKIMVNPEIEKVFHNASYDLRFLGGLKRSKNVICTLEMARKIPYYLVPLPNFQLKTLAEKLCHFSAINKSEQLADWGKRALTEKQLEYAKMDPVYVAQVHHRLLQIKLMSQPDPQTENIEVLATRYRQIEQQWRQLDTEIEHIKKRLKAAMDVQNIPEKMGFKLSSHQKTTRQVSFAELVKISQNNGAELDFSLTLTKSLQHQLEQDLGELLTKLPIVEKTSNVTQLRVAEIEEDELPF